MKAKARYWSVSVCTQVDGVSLTLTESSKAFGMKKARDITRIAKRIASVLGKKLTKNQIAKGVSRAVPVIGGGINGIQLCKHRWFR